MIFLFFIPLILNAESTFLSSDQIAYKDENLSLHGHVSIKHPLGTATADEAEVSGLTGSTFLQAMLKSNVEFFFKEDRLIAKELVLDNEKGEVTAKGPTTLFGKSENFSLTCDGTAHFEKENNLLTFSSETSPISFTKGATHIHAKSAFLTFENDEPKTLTFNDGVDLSNGTITGSAEKLIYELKTHSLQGVGKVSFTLDSNETGNLLELWKKKSS